MIIINNNNEIGGRKNKVERKMEAILETKKKFFLLPKINHQLPFNRN